MVDILYLSWNRREFTEASLKALRENTDWSLVKSITIHDDQSEDGSAQLCVDWCQRGPRVLRTTRMFDHLGSPVAVMNCFLSEERPHSNIFVKLDNDVIVPPGWLNISLEVMDAHPEVDLLGIEPGVGPDPAITKALAGSERFAPNPRGAFPCEFIGGIGLMRRSAFEGRDLPTAAGRFGFGHWQEAHPEIKKAWIAPGLPLFLLNRLPFEPWASLSKEYVAKGWQRDWPAPYTEEDKHMWEWWKP